MAPPITFRGLWARVQIGVTISTYDHLFNVMTNKHTLEFRVFCQALLLSKVKYNAGLTLSTTINKICINSYIGIRMQIWIHSLREIGLHTDRRTDYYDVKANQNVNSKPKVHHNKVEIHVVLADQCRAKVTCSSQAICPWIDPSFLSLSCRLSSSKLYCRRGFWSTWELPTVQRGKLIEKKHSLHLDGEAKVHHHTGGLTHITQPAGLPQLLGVPFDLWPHEELNIYSYWTQPSSF